MPERDAPLLSIRDLRITFRTRTESVRAVDGVSFDVYRGETLGVAFVARPPGDWDFVRGHTADELPAALRDRMERVVMNGDLGIVNVRNLVVEQRRDGTHQAAFRLALLAKEQHVVLGEDRDIEFRDDGIVVADDARVEVFAGLELGEGRVDVLGDQVDAGVGALGHHLGDRLLLVLGGTGVSLRRVEDDRGGAGLVGRTDGDPAHAGVADVVAHLVAQGVAVEGQRRLRIGVREHGGVDLDVHAGHVRSDSWPSLLDS